MKKVLFVLAIVALSACGSATAPEATTDSTATAVDSTTSVDTLKEVK